MPHMYATLDDLLALQPREVLLQLTDDDSDGDFMVAGRRRRRSSNAATRNIEAAIVEATNVIDSYISGRYGTPLIEPYPSLIVQIASHLALCNLYDRRRELDMPEGIKERRNRYMALLKDIQVEKASIPELSSSGGGSTAALVYSPRKEFGDALLSRM